jgi:hypothetical protein
MTSGLDCSAANDEETLDQMTLSPDFVQVALDLEATGMTALEFARLNLFEPPGIHDAIWDLDPQGYIDLHQPARRGFDGGLGWRIPLIPGG